MAPNEGNKARHTLQASSVLPALRSVQECVCRNWPNRRRLGVTWSRAAGTAEEAGWCEFPGAGSQHLGLEV